MRCNKIYLVGRADIADVAKKLNQKGYAVIDPNPLVQKERLAFLLECDAVYFLADWKNDKSFLLAYKIAKSLGFKIYGLYEDYPPCLHWQTYREIVDGNSFIEIAIDVCVNCKKAVSELLIDVS